MFNHKEYATGDIMDPTAAYMKQKKLCTKDHSEIWDLETDLPLPCFLKLNDIVDLGIGILEWSIQLLYPLQNIIYHFPS